MSSAVSECGGRGQLAGPQLYSRIPGGTERGTGGLSGSTGICIVTILVLGLGLRVLAYASSPLEPLWFADIGLRVGYQWCVPFRLCSVAYFRL